MSGPAAPPDGWDETSPAMFSGNRASSAGRLPPEAPGAGAALLRERLAARVAAANAAAGGHPGGAHDEVEQDTRFEPKFFESGPLAPMPYDTSTAAQAPTRTGDTAVDRGADRSMAARPGGSQVDVDVDMDGPAGHSAEAEQRREPWLISGTPANRPASSPSPVNERGNQRWAEAMGEEVDESQPEFRPTEALLHLPDGPPASEPVRVNSRDVAMSPRDVAVEAPPARGSAVMADAHHPSASVAGPMTQPGFLRDAERKARWQRPWVRAALLASCVVLSLTALTQLGLKNRDRYAARWPVTKPVLLELCNWFGCTLQAPRQIDALVVETSSLTRPPGVEGLRLQLVLRNRIDYEVAAPHVELNLTDAAGALMARRVFTPGEFGVARPALGAQQDANWSLVFSTTLRNIAGYSVSVFYP
jgi:hypothetical protein